MTQYGVSKRQAYRYIQEAQKTDHEIPLPEQKVFTTKLRASLIQRIGEKTQATGQSIRNLTSYALEQFLGNGEDHG